MKPLSLKSACLVCCFLTVAGPTVCDVSAADSVFVLDDTSAALADGLSNGDTLTANGIDLTFSNVVVSDGSATGDVEGVGILISSLIDPGATDVVSFDISFSKNVEIKTYDIGSREDVTAGSFFTLSGINGTSGNNTIPAGSLFTEQTFNFDAGTIPFFQAGQAYAFTHNLSTVSDSLFNLEELVVAEIPEPGACTLLSLGCLASCLRRRLFC